LALEDRLDKDEFDVLNERFESDVFGLMGAWRQQSIDTRGIASGSSGCSLSKVCGWINAPGSRPRFDQVQEKLGERWTVEALLLDERYVSIARRHPDALVKARGRLDGSVID